MKALITGITGQCGSYLAEILLRQGYEVHGLIRRISQPNLSNIKGLDVQLHHGDMTDSVSIETIIAAIRPDEIYNLAAMSQVRISYDIPLSAFDINTLGLIRIIESVRRMGLDCKIYQQSSSEMFGMVQETPQRETTPFYPRSPYGISKVASHYVARTYREAYGMKIYSGILFNNESPRRGIEFLSRKVCRGVADIYKGKRDTLTLGNLDARRDWGYSREYMEWVYRMVQSDTPDEYVLATGETHSVREFVAEAFSVVGLTDWEKFIIFDPDLLRAAEVNVLQGDYSKARDKFGFEPQTKFTELVRIMMEAEL